MAPNCCARTAGQTGARGASGGPVTAVIDTNVWLDLFVFQDARVHGLARALQHGDVLALRNHRTDAELQAVLQRPAFAARCDEPARARLIQAWQGLARSADPETGLAAPWICRDPDDQKFLDLAFCAGANLLFTNDRALLDLARKASRSGLRILTAQAFASGPAADSLVR